jgi:hypothetical protein
MKNAKKSPAKSSSVKASSVKSSKPAQKAKSSAKSKSSMSTKASSKSSQGKMMKAQVHKKSAAKNESFGKKDVSERQDIVRLILEDHKPLKKLIKVLKDSERSFDERQHAFSEFAPLLVNHSKPEEQSLYVYMKDESELAEEGYEGDVEHALAEQLLNEIKGTGNKNLWSARVKVLAELVEHHIEEEESELLPDFKKYAAMEDRIQLGEAFLRLKAEFEELSHREVSQEEMRDNMHHPNL